MNQADQYLTRLLADYKKMKREYTKELSKLPPGQLSIRSLKKEASKSINYVQLFPANEESHGKQLRKGITNNPKMIQALARKKYLQQALAILDKNIPPLERLVKIHKAPIADQIIRSLPGAYQNLPEQVFLPKLRERESWAEEEYEQSTYSPKERIHTTACGLKVRSKSEVIIADKLDAYGIPFHYEEMLYIENHSFSPDFTILRESGRVYWEHCGLVGDAAYMQHHKWKLDMYQKAGIVPWKNLIITYDDEEGRLDTRLIESEITLKLL